MVQRLLPSLAPDGMTIKLAPSFADFPLYNADIQNSTGFPAPVNTLADAIRAADGFQHSRRVEERNRLGLAAPEPAFRRQAYRNRHERQKRRLQPGSCTGRT
jgi:hypothetical protein